MMEHTVWDYYKEVARATGRDKNNKELRFSLEFYYHGDGPEAPNDFIRYLQGEPGIQLQAVEPPAPEELRQYTSQVRQLNDGQLDAISKALSYPISLVQGPPGTGKTEMILNLISVLRHYHPEASVAIVSTNNEALSNIGDKLFKGRETDPMLLALAEKFAVLGKKANIKNWRKLCAQRGEDVSAIDPQSVKIHSRYLRQYPVFSSTVHSLRKIFEEDCQFDYVIADECSQMSIMLGLITMSCARTLVLIGDNNQLPPVIPHTVKEISRQYQTMDGGLDALWLEAEGKSFLTFCEAAFPQAPRAFLRCHYRCHPSIIQFCSRYVYQDQLIIKTKDDGRFPLRAVWYEGDYCEKVSVPEEDEDGQEEQTYRNVIYNIRQIEIFLREELPRLAPRLQDPNFSAAVICPFRYEIELLSDRLGERLGELGLKDSDITKVIDEDDLPRLTIHKAQGKGFDVVYLLTVEDYYVRDLWSQRMRMVNVAVSRAKKEFCVIASSQWLPEELQEKWTGYILPSGEDSEPEQMYCQKLLRYIADNCPEPQGEFGFHRSAVTSVFDQVPRLRREIPCGAKHSAQLLSAPAKCVEAALLAEFGQTYTLVRELPLREIDQVREVRSEDPELNAYLETSRIDFALCEGTRIRLLVEVDGAYHRDRRSAVWRNDRKKDRWIRELLKAGDIFVRLPTDGSTENEMALLRSRLAGGKTVLTVSPEALTRAGTVARAQDTRQALLLRLEREIGKNLTALREFWARTDLDTDRKIGELALDYRQPEAVTYDSEAGNSFYLCRYAVAYAFEYAMLYELALRLRMDSGSKIFSVFSFGTGTFLDAWSMAYAKARLTMEDPAYDEIALYDKGIDKVKWNTWFVDPTQSFGEDGPVPNPAGERELDGLFQKIWFYNWDIDRFLREDILGRPKKSFYYDTLMLPKIINELGAEDVDRIVEALGQINFPRDEYYLLVSHSASQRKREESAQILRRFFEAIDREGEFEVCCCIDDLLSRDSRKAFARAWLGSDSLVPSVNIGSPQLPQCYEFSSARGAEGRNAEAAYLDQLNPDLSYDGPREFLQKLGEETALRTNQVRRASQIVFDIVRLKRRTG